MARQPRDKPPDLTRVGVGVVASDPAGNLQTIPFGGAGGGGGGLPTTIGGLAYAPMTTGAEPLEIMSDGAGHVLMIAFEP